MTSVPVGTAELLRVVLDAGSFRCWDGTPRHECPDPDYRRQLARAAARSGNDEAVRTGVGAIGGHAVAVICSEFAFLAGSVGAATADRIVAAVERATESGLPLLAMTASGGTRMQEGTPAFLRMADIAAALVTHKDAGLPYLVHLGHPTTGGVLASWGSLGHLTFAEPGALVGFLGPKVQPALLRGRSLPAGVQTAENLYAHGRVDALLTAEQLRSVVGNVLRLLRRPVPTQSGRRGSGRHGEDAPGVDDVAAWTHVMATRRPGRPGVRDLLTAASPDTVPIGPEDTGDVLALTRFGTTPCVLVGQDRHRQTWDPIGARAMRTAVRGMALAAELQLPLVTVIDTAGAELSAAAEAAGLAAQIAGCLAGMLTVPTPTVSLLLGEGAGGAALALMPADRMLAARHAWLMPLPPEGAAAISHGRPGGPAEAARTHRITARDMRAAGAVDRIVEECPDAAEEPVNFCRRVVAAIGEELDWLCAIPQPRQVALRRRRARGRRPITSPT